MPPKNIPKLDPSTVYYHTPEGLQQLYTLDEAPDIEAETEWPKENPYIKSVTDATLSAELELTPDGVAFFRDLAGAASEVYNLALIVREYCVEICNASRNKRAVHLAKYGKKYRTRKKNVHRLVRYVAKRIKE